MELYRGPHRFVTVLYAKFTYGLSTFTYIFLMRSRYGCLSYFS